MSDLSIPGVNGTYEKLIEALMKKESIPRDREAENLEKLKLKDNSLRQINKFSLEVRDIARNLYSFNNPFAEKNVESSNERAVTATASRSAKDQSVKVRIIQTAAEDKFLSAEIEDNMEVEKGKYTFKIGEKEISVNWKGGKYKSFINLVNSRTKDFLTINEIKITSDKKSLLFASKMTGEKNRLEFKDDALNFALKMGLIKRSDTTSIKTSANTAEVKPETASKITFSQTAKAGSQYLMEIKLALKDTGQEPQNENTEAESTVYEEIGSISYKGITIQNEASKDGLKKTGFKNLPKEPKSPDMNLFSLESVRGVLIPIPPVSDTETEQTITIPLSEYGDVKALAINNNTGKTVLIENIRIYDPKAVGDYVPVNPVSTAKDAIVDFEGIQVKREKNNVEDLIPGVTLHLHDSTEKHEKITIKPNTEAAKNSIIEFVAKYNRLIAQINILTQIQPEVIEELGYLSEEEKADAEKKLGIMYGDSSLSSFKGSLRQIVNEPYKPNEDAPIFMLSQMGISTKSDSSGGIDRSRLRGYLEIDEKKLDETLKNDMEAVKFFFGFDSDGDILVDSGLAHRMYEQLNPYTQRGGIFSVKTDSLKSRIDSSQKKIDNYDKKLAEKEKELKKKYGVMEGTLKTLEKRSREIENFKKSMESQKKQ